MSPHLPRLKMLPLREYVGVNRDDPIRFYYWPIFGKLYRRRVELCMGELTGGKSVLEVGFGSGVAFLNLHDLYGEIHGLDRQAAVPEIVAAFRARGIESYLRNGSVLQMPFPDGFFDSVLAISIFEHLRPEELLPAVREVRRVLRAGGQFVYGAPLTRPLMTLAYGLLGVNINRLHFSTEDDIARATGQALERVRITSLNGPAGLGPIYEVGHFRRT